MGNFLKDELISGIVTVFQSLGITLNLSRDILVFSSHGPDKQSYHIIVDHYYLLNHLEAKALYEKVAAATSSEHIFKFFVDDFYSSCHNLRLVWNHKRDSNRTKIFEPEFLLNNTKITYDVGEDCINLIHYESLIMSRSLITFVSGCVQLPTLIIGNTVKREEVILGDEVVGEVLTILRNYSLHLGDGELAFDISSSYQGSNYIELERMKEHCCEMCNVYHEHERPYAYVYGQNVYFNCRRSVKHVGKNVSKIIGFLSDDPRMDAIKSKLSRLPAKSSSDNVQTIESLRFKDSPLRHSQNGSVQESKTNISQSEQWLDSPVVERCNPTTPVYHSVINSYSNAISNAIPNSHGILNIPSTSNSHNTYNIPDSPSIPNIPSIANIPIGYQSNIVDWSIQNNQNTHNNQSNQLILSHSNGPANFISTYSPINHQHLSISLVPVTNCNQVVRDRKERSNTAMAKKNKTEKPSEIDYMKIISQLPQDRNPYNVSASPSSMIFSLLS